MNPGFAKVKGQAEVIFFDAVGTLIHLVRPAGWHYAEIARRHGLAIDGEILESEFRRIWRARPLRAPTKGPRTTDDRSWWKALALEVLHASATVPSDFDEGLWFEDVYQRFAEPGVWALYGDAEASLARLQVRHRLAVLSNFDGRLRVILEDLGVAPAFERLFISSELGCEKPHFEIFRRAVAAMGVQPHQCLHVGDDPENDRAGALAAGLSSFLLQRPVVSLDDLRAQGMEILEG